MRHDIDGAKLPEMRVKSKRLLDLEAINYRIADAICKTPLFVAKLFKDLPSSLNIGLANPNKLSKRASK
jgi:hypothetical protein